MRAALCWSTDPARAEVAWQALGMRDPSAFSLVHGVAPPGVAPNDGWWTVAVLEDDAPSLREQERVLAGALGTPVQRVEGGDVTTWLQWLADLEAHALPRLTATTADTRPAAVATLAEDGPLVFHVPAGRLHVFPGDRPAAPVWRRTEATGFIALEAVAAPGADPVDAPATPEDVALATLRRRIRAAFDPHGILVLADRA